MKIRLARVNRHIFKEAGIEFAVAVQILFIRIQHAIAVQIFAGEHVLRRTINEPQFVHRFERRVFRRVTERCVIERDNAVRAAPVHDGVGKIGRDVRQILKNIGADIVQIQLATLVHEAEIRFGGIPPVRITTDEPELRVAHRHGFAFKLRVVRHHAVRRVIQEHKSDVARRALDGLVRHETADAIIRRAQLVGHRVCKIQCDGDETDAHPQHDDEHRCVFAALIHLEFLVAQFHFQLPVVLVSTLFVRDCESIGTTS